MAPNDQASFPRSSKHLSSPGRKGLRSAGGLNIAVIGSGISGLAAAWLLSKKHRVSLFERDSRLGGHSNTVDLDLAEGPRGGRYRFYRLQ